ncbi:MAG: nucleotidyltransferase [Eubacteriales bacterium]|nr:nucleotidyltransferase [Eubacteriales bacterium]
MTVGIVAEYNPFHNGHQYQIEQARKLTGADTVAVVMSGNFVQRGEPAICNKWSRARMALSCGADLVVELPVCFAVRSAEPFARGAISILNSLGVDCVAFGSETDDLKLLKKAAKALLSEGEEESKIIREYMNKGFSYPAAVSKAYPDFSLILDNPNSLLGVEYIKAGAKNPVAVLRKGVNHDGGAVDDFASASFIRNNIQDAEGFMPKPAYEILCKEHIIPNHDKLSDIVLAKLRDEKGDTLKSICDVSEGIENRIIAASKVVSNLGELYDLVKTKRFTHARIRRIITNYALGITKDFEEATPEYVRVLGSNSKGFELLKKCQLPVITKTAGFENKMFKREAYATDLYSLLFDDAVVRKGGKDFTTSPIIIN